MINDTFQINIYKDNVLNINSERFFREAEDCFYYFSQNKKAIQKLDEALKLTPTHVKSLKLKGDVLYTEGRTEEALQTYMTAAALQPDSPALFGSVASCLENKGEYSKALLFCENAVDLLEFDDYVLKASLTELKISLLIKLKRYKEAENLIYKAEKTFSPEEILFLKVSEKNILKYKLDVRKRLAKLKIRSVQ